MVSRLILILTLALVPLALFAQITVEDPKRTVVTGPQYRDSASTSTPDSASAAQRAAMSTTAAQDVVNNADKYYGRSTWTSTQFDSVVAENGMDTRDGQHAAIASVLLRMKEGDRDGARERLDRLFSMPGYVIDSDIAQILSAVDVILNMPPRVDTVVVTKDRYADQPVPDGEQDYTDNVPPSPKRPAMANALSANNTNGQQRQPDVQKATPNSTQSSDPAATALAAFEARLRQLEGQVQQLATQNNSRQTPDGDADNADAEEQADMNAAPLNAEWPEAFVTRRCFTIEIERHAYRVIAERRVNSLRNTYKRVRLAIDQTSEQPFVVIVGYYQTERSAVAAIPAVSRTTRRACKVMETTIAEKL